MNANFYHFQKLAQEHQAEISKELSTHHLLDKTSPNTLTEKQARHLKSRVAPAVIFIIITMSLLSLSIFG